MLFCMLGELVSQNVTVSGTVIDGDSQEPLIGVTIVESSTSNGTTTDLDGSYRIEVSPDAVLTFSYTGYASQDVPVDGRSTIDISLSTATTLLDEIVVVGYGTMEKNNVTGAISTVNVDELAKVPVPNVVEGLRGQVPGLRISRTSGQPGSGITFRIRGTNSLGAAAGDLDATGRGGLGELLAGARLVELPELAVAPDGRDGGWDILGRRRELHELAALQVELVAIRHEDEGVVALVRAGGARGGRRARAGGEQQGEDRDDAQHGDLQVRP